MRRFFVARPDVTSVVHAHAEDTLPFSLVSTLLEPVIHSGSFIVGKVPVRDIAAGSSMDGLREAWRKRTAAAQLNPLTWAASGKTNTSAKGCPSECAGGQPPRSPVFGRWSTPARGFPSLASNRSGSSHGSGPSNGKRAHRFG